MDKKLTKALDGIDIKILNELQRNGKISNIDLSKKVGLSPTPCLERVKRLEKQGVIMGYRALLNPELLDSPLLVIVEITLVRGKPDVFEEFNISLLTNSYGSTIQYTRFPTILFLISNSISPITHDGKIDIPDNGKRSSI